MINYQGTNSQHITLVDNRAIYGSIEAGATVPSGVSSVLYGAFAGPLDVQQNAIFTVHGSFMGSVSQNDGTLILSGQIGVSPSQIPGNVAVCVGSLLTFDRPKFLRSDGSLEGVPGTGKVNISVNADASSACVFDHARGIFIPLTSNSTE